MIELHEVAVFCGPDGRHGNLLGVVLDGSAVPEQAERRSLAAGLGFSETVFVDDLAAGVVEIHTPSVALPFAGYPLIGTAWLLRHLSLGAAETLRPAAGEVPAWPEGDLTWIRARSAWVPDRELRGYSSTAEVDDLPAPPPGEGWLYAWAWQAEKAGRVRARGFPRRGDSIVEDEATGAAAVALTAALGRSLDIRQGRGSQILTRAAGPDVVEVGGRVRHVGSRRV